MTGDTFTITGTIEFTKIVCAPENAMSTIELAGKIKESFPALAKDLMSNLFDDAKVTELKVFPAEAAVEPEPVVEGPGIDVPGIEEDECEACKIDIPSTDEKPASD